MDFEHYKIDFIDAATNSGYTEQNILKCLNYAEVLFKNNVPVIYNLSHLSALVGYKREYIKKATSHTKFYYRDFSILKKNGKKRLISEPLPSLKDIQYWILNNILINVKVSPFAKAYKKKVSLKENLKFHKEQKKVFTLDIENFFPSIKTNDVEKIFKSLGYSELLSNTIAKLCTKDHYLPQGAPTSPCLSNIFFKEADEKISKYCMSKKIMYTRYADDLSFSGDFDEKQLLMIVKESLDGLNLNLNNEKTKLMTSNMRQTVTGIVVNEKLQVEFKKRNKLRQDIYYIKKYTLADHMRFKNIKKANYLEHLIGKVNFVLQINPNDKEFIEYKTYLLKLKNENK